MTIINNSTSAFFDRSMQGMSALRSSADKLQQQLSTGNKLARSSDDPVKAARLRTLQRADALSQIDTTNANRASADLTLADSALSSFSNYISRARELAVQAGNGTLSAGDRSAISTELGQIYDNMVSVANTRDSTGHALFGGQNSGNAYEVDGSGKAVYVGTSSSGDLSLGHGQSVTRSVTGPEFLNYDVNGKPTNVMDVVKQLSDALQSTAADPAKAASDALTSLSAGLDSVTTAQTVVGTRLAWIDMAGQRQTNLNELRSTEESDIGGTDVASTVANLQQVMLVLQASQAGFSKLSSLSLFDVLR